MVKYTKKIFKTCSVCKTETDIRVLYNFKVHEVFMLTDVCLSCLITLKANLIANY